MNKQEIKTEIIKLATERGADKTICPSEVARSLFKENWPAQMQKIREAAFDLEADQQIMIMQKGKKVNPKEVKGPIRIQIKR